MRQYLNLIGDGTCEDPDVIVRWSGHEYGHALADRDDFLRMCIVNEMGLWPIIDLMLVRIYGEMSEEERIEWYHLHRDDLVEITAPPDPEPRELTVFRWSDKMQFRPITQVFDEVVIPELKQIHKSQGTPDRTDDESH